MKQLIKLEEILFFLSSILLFNQLDFAWWWYLILILAPDISMIGYVFNTKIGAITYNLFHHRGIAITLIIVGWQLDNQIISLCGIILFGHASMDRIFGYGLKHFDSFKNTHLGKIG